MSNFDATSLLALLGRALAREPKGAGRAGAPVAWASTRGSTRKENQDRILVARASSGLVVAILADGMGGMKEGTRAAVLAAAAIASRCVSGSSLPVDAILRNALHGANDEVFRLLRGEGGAAVVVAASLGDAIYVAHAGDARAYKLDEAGLLAQLTVDDTVQAQLQHIGRAADPTVPSNHHLLQFVGLGSGFEPHVSVVPGTSRGLLLTSDGAHSIPSDVLSWIAASAEHLQTLAERVVTASEWHGGRDNATAVVIGLQNGQTPQPELASEFWLPGDHIFVVDDPSPTFATVRASAERIERGVVTPPVVPNRELVNPPPSKKQRNNKRRGRGDKKRTSKEQPDSGARLPMETGRQLPIVTFDNGTEDAPSNADSQNDVPRPGERQGGALDEPKR